MQELQVKVTQAQVEIIDREKFEQNIADVVAKYENYTVTAATIKGDKQVLAELRKLKKQISDERIKIKRELSQSADEFDDYIKTTGRPLDDTIDKIAQDVKAFEEHQRTIRIDAVRVYIANKAAEYQLDARLFDNKIENYTKASDFMADGYTLKKATMKSLDDLVTFEFQNQQEYEKAKTAISGQCAEYGMTNLPYLRMLRDLTLAEVLEQIRSDYVFEQQKREVERARQEQILAEQARRKQEENQKASQTLQIDPEAGEIIERVELYQNQENEHREVNKPQKCYIQKITLEIYLTGTDEKNHLKSVLSQAGFEVKQNYWVSGYQAIAPLTQEELIAEKEI